MFLSFCSNFSRIHRSSLYFFPFRRQQGFWLYFDPIKWADTGRKRGTSSSNLMPPPSHPISQYVLMSRLFSSPATKKCKRWSWQEYIRWHVVHILSDHQIQKHNYLYCHLTVCIPARTERSNGETTGGKRSPSGRYVLVYNRETHIPSACEKYSGAGFLCHSSGFSLWRPFAFPFSMDCHCFLYLKETQKDQWIGCIAGSRQQERQERRTKILLRSGNNKQYSMEYHVWDTERTQSGTRKEKKRQDERGCLLFSSLAWHKHKRHR